MHGLQLVRPGPEHLAAYGAALQCGWSADNLRGAAAARRRRGHATRALALMLPLARERGLYHVEITTDPDNQASQRVILANGRMLVETFDKGAAYGHAPGLRYRIALGP